ncbi:MAG: hypothetical protein GTO46_08505 [Gemmatimonadetes bacterium]|nr:hypothetical protein [Gemmatimonadota bacterium]NIO31676.1 hypothetical protein [Gemmatimonadota bacterium]
MSTKRLASVILVLPLLALSDAVLQKSALAQSRDADRNVLYDPALFADLTYRMVGPSRGGRVTAVTGIAEQPATFYMGATGGGVWKTTDYGQSWENVSDGYFETASIGAIDVADSDPDVVYVGTGSDGIRSNVITGRGVYKSTDAGETWTFLGLREAGQIGAVIVHPQDPNLVYIAAIGQAFAPNPERGVYRTNDGGDSWEQILFVSDSTGAVDLEFAPDNPREIYASMWRAERKPWTIISGAREGGVYKSTDGGDSWTKLTNGLPGDLIGKSDLAVSPADPDRLYVLMEAADAERGLYRSDDRGASFRLVNTEPGLTDRPFYYCNVDADPSNADVVYVNSTRFYKSEDGGATFRRRGTPHGDNHDMWINPNDSDLYIQSNDGGANVTRDGGDTWSTQRNQPTAELYQVDVDDRFPYWLYAGQQDNSTIAVPSLPPYSAPGGATAHWRSIGGCETGPAVPKPGDPDIVYANCKGRFGRYNAATGQEKQYYVGAQNLYGHNPKDLNYRFQRVSPIEISPHDPNVVYHASQYLHRTTDEGVTWETISPDLTAFKPERQMASGMPLSRDITGEEHYSTLYAVEESPLTRGLIWVGANDGPVHVTRDGGRTWTEVTPADLPPEGRVQTIEPSPHRPGKAYIAVYRYLLGDWRPYIYRTEDYGASWTILTSGDNGIPADYPTRVVREDPDREGLLYAGTEFGMFISFDDGAHWQPFQQNLPVTPVTDIKVYRQDLVLSTMGRSFWILHDITPLRELDRRVASAEAHLFQPRDAYRMRYSSGGRGAAAPEYPTAGAVIDYYLAEEPAGAAKLEILDAGGDLIRSFTSEGPARRAPAQRERMGFGSGSASGAGLEKTTGMHRFTWDLRYQGARDPESGRIGRGPMAPPGTYQARLSVGDWRQTRSFQLLIDPRVAADGVTQEDLEQQLAFNLRLLEMTSEARGAARRVRGLREDLAGLSEVTDERGLLRRARILDDQLAAIESLFVTSDVGRYPQPMLLDQLRYLGNMTDDADQKLGADAYTRFDELNAELAGHQAAIERLLETELAELNTLLENQGLAPLSTTET